MLYTRPSCAHRLAFSAGRTRPCTPPITPCLPARYSTPAADAASHSHDVGILGGGITGLASAYYLNRQHPNAKITLYEAKDRVGGWLEAKRVPVEGGNVLFEAGPRTLRPQGNGVLAAKLVWQYPATPMCANGS
jgi:oxygen-dependent protoporphyrinogen oxidase